MPGHKGRGAGALPFDMALPYDVTELDATDNLYAPAPDGVFRAELDFMRSVYGTAATIITAGGATAAICAAVACCARRSPGLSMLCDRKAHISVINALALTGVEPVWFDAGAVTDAKIDEFTSNLSGAQYSAVFITSPDYYGTARDVASLAKLSAKLGAPLIVDNSHGAHLFFHGDGTLHPLKQGAALVIDSLHKTLPALTGGALLHAADIYADDDAQFDFTEAELLSALRLFTSTSPSYLISSSVCACVRELAESGNIAHAALLREVTSVRSRLAALGFTLDTPDDDPFRICICYGDAQGLYDYLARNGVVCEFCDGHRVVLLTSIRNTHDDFALLTDLCAGYKPVAPENNSLSYEFYLPQRAITLREALLSRQERVPLATAFGRIAASPAAPYPPGITCIAPGEVYDEKVIAALGNAGVTECDVVLWKE